MRVEIEVARRRASTAENELLILRKANYQQELQIKELRILFEESKAKERDAMKKCENLQYEYHTLKF